MRIKITYWQERQMGWVRDLRWRHSSLVPVCRGTFSAKHWNHPADSETNCKKSPTCTPSKSIFQSDTTPSITFKTANNRGAANYVCIVESFHTSRLLIALSWFLINSWSMAGFRTISIVYKKHQNKVGPIHQHISSSEVIVQSKSQSSHRPHSISTAHLAVSSKINIITTVSDTTLGQ